MGMEGRNRQPWHRDGAEQGWEWECTEGRLWGEVIVPLELARGRSTGPARGWVGSGGGSDGPE